jgi:Iap family predicted aminopeptidase
VRVQSDTANAPFKAIWNTFGVIRGTDFPDEVVVIGAHRDAWSPGAVDNVSGTTSVVESARAIAEQMNQGWGAYLDGSPGPAASYAALASVCAHQASASTVLQNDPTRASRDV